MFRSRSRIYTRTGSGIPLFFKLWFAFVAILAVSLSVGVAAIIYSVISDPAVIGSFVAEIMNGYNGTIIPENPAQ